MTFLRMANLLAAVVALSFCQPRKPVSDGAVVLGHPSYVGFRLFDCLGHLSLGSLKRILVLTLETLDLGSIRSHYCYCKI